MNNKLTPPHQFLIVSEFLTKGLLKLVNPTSSHKIKTTFNFLIYCIAFRTNNYSVQSDVSHTETSAQAHHITTIFVNIDSGLLPNEKEL